MPYDLENRLVVGLASSALFDLTESDLVFREKGEHAYRIYQRENQNNPLQAGVAFEHVVRPATPVVEVAGQHHRLVRVEGAQQCADVLQLLLAV